MPKSAPSPLLIEQADALTLAMQIRAAASKALRAGAKGARLEANFEDHMRPVLQDAGAEPGRPIWYIHTKRWPPRPKPRTEPPRKARATK